MRARDEPRQFSRLPHGHKDVALAADHEDRHGEGPEPVAGAVPRAGRELARERLRLLRVGVLEHDVASELDCALVLEELLGEVEQEQLVDDALAGHLAHACAPDVGERPRPGAAGGECHREGQRPHPLGRRQRHLLRDRAAHRNAEQVEAVEPERVGQAERVLRHVRDLVLASRPRGLPDVAVVEDDRAVALGEGGDLQHPGEGVGRQPHHAEQRLTLTVLLVVDRLAVGLDLGHRAGA